MPEREATLTTSKEPIYTDRHGTIAIANNAIHGVLQFALYLYVGYIIKPQSHLGDLSNAVVFLTLVLFLIVPSAYVTTFLLVHPKKRAVVEMCVIFLQIGIALFFLGRILRGIISDDFAQVSVILSVPLATSSFFLLCTFAFPPSVPPDP